MTTFTPEEEILASGTVDWIDFSEAHGLTRKWAEGKGLDVETEVARVIKTLLESQWMVAGDVKEGQGFVPWLSPPDRAVKEVLSRWRALGRDPVPGDVSWFQNTAKGEDRGKQVIAEHKRSGKRWIFDDYFDREG